MPGVAVTLMRIGIIGVASEHSLQLLRNRSSLRSGISVHNMRRSIATRDLIPT